METMETNASDHLTEDMIKFEDTGIIEENEIFPQESLYMDEAEEESEPDDIIILHMDIRDPLTTLRTLLENKIGVDLKKYEFWLQDAQVLESHKNLVDQCVKGEGLVQINVQIQAINERINIVDVLKPTEAALATLGTPETEDKKVAIEENDDSVNSAWEENNSSVLSMDEESDREDLVVNWILDNRFRREQSRLKIPDDPQEWTTAQVKHWLQWAVRQFNLSQIKLSDWEISGKDLCGLTLEDFQTKVPIDPGNVFWTHLELLRKCKFVATIQKTDRKSSKDNGPTILRKTQKVIKKPITTAAKNFEHWIGLEQCESNRNRLGNNGQVQLWQFLLDILTDMQYKQIIQWIGGEGEFKLTDPERVAQLWGERKNKPAMNYEKLSRALRYYYDGDMISKVHGKRFVYKFVCDLKQLIGYNAKELAELVSECSFAEFG